MTKQEFEERTKLKVADDEYEIIQVVYAYHPMINGINGKEQIAQLYRIGGMRLMKDMLTTAKIAALLEEQIHHAQDELRALEERYDKLKR